MIEINNNNLEEFLDTDKPVLLYMTTAWCGPCKTLKPIIEKLSVDNTQFDFGKIDLGVEKELAAKYEVMSVPTLMFFKNGILELRKTGVMPENLIIEELTKLV